MRARPQSFNFTRVADRRALITLATCGLAISCVASVAEAANTRFVMEVSTDRGVTWSNSIAVAPGSQVRARLRAEFIGTETVTGLEGFNTQFMVDGWSLGDAIEDVWGTFCGVAGCGFANGQIPPFNASSRAPTVAVTNATLLLSGHASARIPIGQEIGTNFNSSLNPAVFIFTFNVGAEPGTRAINATNIFNTAANNAKWYTGTGVTTINAPIANPATDIVGATVFVPSAGVTAPLIAAALGCLIRRRR